ncbi:hypothetical protein HDU83_000046 [Entophlyctis luteolus]|nr:hypothetical protein HDU83_000046 [Entophlyctis luteolus]
MLAAPPSPDGSAFSEEYASSDLSWTGEDDWQFAVDDDDDEEDVVVDTPFVWEYTECSSESPKGAFSSVDPMELAFLTSCKISDEQDIPNYRVLRLVVMQNTLTALYSMWTPSENPAYAGLTDDERKNQSFADALNAMRVAALQLGPDHDQSSKQGPDAPISVSPQSSIQLQIPLSEPRATGPEAKSDLPLFHLTPVVKVEEPAMHKAVQKTSPVNSENKESQVSANAGMGGVENTVCSPVTLPKSENQGTATKSEERSDHDSDSRRPSTILEKEDAKPRHTPLSHESSSEYQSHLQLQDSTISSDISSDLISSDSKVFGISETKAVTEPQLTGEGIKSNKSAATGTTSDRLKSNIPIVVQDTSYMRQSLESTDNEVGDIEISKKPQTETKPAVIIPPRTYSKRTSQIIRESAKIKMLTAPVRVEHSSSMDSPSVPISVLEPVEVVGKDGALVETFEKLWGDRLAGYVNMHTVTPPVIPQRVMATAEKIQPTRSDTVKTANSIGSTMTSGGSQKPFLSLSPSPSLLTLLDSHVDPSTVLNKLPRGTTAIDRRPSQLSVRSSTASGTIKRRATRNKPLPNLPPENQNLTVRAASNRDQDRALREGETKVKKRLSFVFDGLEKVMFDNVSIESVTEEMAQKTRRASAEPLYSTSNTSDDNWGESVLSLIMGSTVNRSSSMTVASARERRIKKAANRSDEPLNVLYGQHAADSDRNSNSSALSNGNGRTAKIPVRSSSRVKSLDIDSAMARYKDMIQQQDWLVGRQKQGAKRER